MQYSPQHIMPIYGSGADIQSLNIKKIPKRVSSSNTVLMCTPEYFSVIDEKNEFMRGQAGSTDANLAQKQWEQLKAVYEELGLTVETIQGQQGVEDMVFSANCGMVWQEDRSEEKHFLASRMLHDARAKEIPHYSAWFKSRGYQVHNLPTNKEIVFEGGGDVVWFPGRQLFFCGYGHRTSMAAIEEIERQFGFYIIPLELSSREFYHLDTALCVLDEKTALYCPYAFNDTGNAILETTFPERITISVEQGAHFTANCFSVGGKHVVLQQGDQAANKELREKGFTPVEVDLSEYVKSGGNATCLKLNIY